HRYSEDKCEKYLFHNIGFSRLITSNVTPLFFLSSDFNKPLTASHLIINKHG
ncbi:MAG: hypothetical protein ACI87V_002087, partial [Flavobacteriales bacterium]